MELVKNSYDACATRCNVHFETKPAGDNGEFILTKIAVEDDGFGMDKDVIEDVWLTVGTDYKRQRLRPNACDRIPLGEKGIGRLSVHKLGNDISLVSKKRGKNEVEVHLDWKELNNAKYIEDFKVDVVENSSPNIFRSGTGTIINVSDLKGEWDRRKLREIYRSLTALNSPFDGTNEKFRVKVTCNSDLFEGLPQFEEIKESALYHGRCSMKGKKIVKFKYEFTPWDTLTKIDKGRTKQEDELLAEELRLRKDTTRRVPTEKDIIDLDEHRIGPIDFEVLIFETDAQIFNYSLVNKKSVTDFLRDNGGVRVYRDGVRVYDYGEKENDWLGIDLRRVSSVGTRVSNSILIGAVKVKRESSIGLKEKTNREGFIEDDSYKVFKDAVNYALRLIVKERNVDKTRLATLYKEHKVAEPVLSDLDEVIEVVHDKVEKGDTRDELMKYLDRIGSQYKEVKEVLIKSANAGLNLGVVIHELEKLISQLAGKIKRKRYEEAIEISLMLEKIIRGYSVMLKKSSIEYSELSAVVKSALEAYEFRFSDHKIRIISNYDQSDLKGYLAKAESISVLLNLLDNAIYWLSYARVESRKISVFITDQIKGYNSIVVSDNGPGFNIPTDAAIQPFITGKPHNVGSGLGLHIANEMMKAMKGQLLFLDEGDIKLPGSALTNEVSKAMIGLCFRSSKTSHGLL